MMSIPACCFPRQCREPVEESLNLRGAELERKLLGRSQPLHYSRGTYLDDDVLHKMTIDHLMANPGMAGGEARRQVLAALSSREQSVRYSRYDDPPPDSEWGNPTAGKPDRCAQLIENVMAVLAMFAT
jgi:hypothetical protein